MEKAKNEDVEMEDVSKKEDKKEEEKKDAPPDPFFGNSSIIDLSRVQKGSGAPWKSLKRERLQAVRCLNQIIQEAQADV